MDLHFRMRNLSMTENFYLHMLQALEWCLLALAQKDSDAFYEDVLRFCVDAAMSAHVRKHVRHIAGSLSIAENRTLYIAVAKYFFGFMGCCGVSPLEGGDEKREALLRLQQGEGFPPFLLTP